MIHSSPKRRQLKPTIYISNLESASSTGLLNIDFEQKYMFHTAFIHGHAHWPPLLLVPKPKNDPTFDDSGANNGVGNLDNSERQFYGSVQPAVFDGDREWDVETKELFEKCLVRIAPVMMQVGMSAPSL